MKTTEMLERLKELRKNMQEYQPWDCYDIPALDAAIELLNAPCPKCTGTGMVTWDDEIGEDSYWCNDCEGTGYLFEAVRNRLEVRTQWKEVYGEEYDGADDSTHD